MTLTLACACTLSYRKRELSKLKTQERFIAGNRFAFFSIPIITALSTFVSYSLLGA